MTTQHSQIELPDLRILPVSSLLLHEQHDAQRSEPLAMRLAADGILRNPPIVAPIPGEPRFAVLDGANRVAALMSLGIPHVVAQVVDYEDEELILDTWYHLVSDLPRRISIAPSTIARRHAPRTKSHSRAGRAGPARSAGLHRLS
jgi:hypothetical protein